MQFSEKSLARLLLNVDRDTLKNAVGRAELWDLFDSRERQALRSLADLFEGKELDLTALADDPFRIAEQLFDYLPAGLEFLARWVLRILELFLDRPEPEEEEPAVDTNLIEIQNLIKSYQSSIISRLHEFYRFGVRRDRDEALEIEDLSEMEIYAKATKDLADLII